MPDWHRLCLRGWPVAQAENTVLIVHGRGEQRGRPAALARWLNKLGFSVRSYDQSGHGRTPGQRGGLRRAHDLLTDLASVCSAFSHEVPTPPLLLGHSMGGLVALRTVLDGLIAPPALVLASPALRSREPAWRVRLANSWLAWRRGCHCVINVRGSRLRTTRR